jgi:hypothetical protein
MKQWEQDRMDAFAAGILGAMPEQEWRDYRRERESL